MFRYSPMIINVFLKGIQVRSLAPPIDGDRVLAVCGILVTFVGTIDEFGIDIESKFLAYVQFYAVSGASSCVGGSIRMVFRAVFWKTGAG